METLDFHSHARSATVCGNMDLIPIPEPKPSCTKASRYMGMRVHRWYLLRILMRYVKNTGVKCRLSGQMRSKIGKRPLCTMKVIHVFNITSRPRVHVDWPIMDMLPSKVDKPIVNIPPRSRNHSVLTPVENDIMENKLGDSK